MELIRPLLDLLHLNPESLNALADQLGPWLYVLLFGIIFAETGLVVTPFLPGDSLLFAVGAVAASPGSPINFSLVCVLLIVAAVAGRRRQLCHRLLISARRSFAREIPGSSIEDHLLEAHEFYERYGSMTIILARFMPIIRTFAPFVAGIGKMTYRRFAVYNVIGGVVWVLLFLLAGWWFGGLEIVRKPFRPGHLCHHLHLDLAAGRAVPASAAGQVTQGPPEEPANVG